MGRKPIDSGRFDALLDLIAGGMSTAAACQEIGISDETVRTRLRAGEKGENDWAIDFKRRHEEALQAGIKAKNAAQISAQPAEDPSETHRRTLEAAALIGWEHPDGPTPEDASPAELERRADAACRARLLPYLVATYHGDRPYFEVNWHHVVEALVIEWCIEGFKSRLMLSQPTRTGKSLVVRGAIAWHMGKHPYDPVMGGSYGDDLAAEASVAVKDIVASPEHQRIFPECKLPTEADAKARHISAKGYYWKLDNKQGSLMCKAVATSPSGFPACLLFIDDPVKDYDTANSPIKQHLLFNVVNSAWRRRLQNRQNMMIIMTRWGEKDLIGQFLALAASDPAADQWLVINLPDVLDGDPEPWDPRQPGEHIWPGLHRMPWETPSPEEEADRLDKIAHVMAVLPKMLAERTRPLEVGEVAFSVLKKRAIEEAQSREATDPVVYQAMDRGKPKNPKGEKILKSWLERRWEDLPADLERIVFVDAKRATASPSQDARSSYAVANAYGRSRSTGEIYLLDEERDRWGLTDTGWAVRRLCERVGTTVVRIENKAAAPALADILSKPATDAQGKVWPALSVKLQEIKGTKSERLGRVEHMLSGVRSLLLLPAAQLRWLPGWIAEMTGFSDRPHEINDRVDVLTLALAFWANSGQHFEYRPGPKKESAGWRTALAGR